MSGPDGWRSPERQPGDPAVERAARALADALQERGWRTSADMPGDERIDLYEVIACEVLAGALNDDNLEQLIEHGHDERLREAGRRVQRRRGMATSPGPEAA